MDERLKRELLAFLGEIHQTASSSRFTDRHDWAGRSKSLCLRLKEDRSEGDEQPRIIRTERQDVFDDYQGPDP